jgi:hypothetical protein
MIENDNKIFQKWIDEHQARIINIICTISDEEKMKRFNTRPRHPAHHDHERDMSVYSNDKEIVYEQLPGKKIRIETNKEVNKLIEELVSQL